VTKPKTGGAEYQRRRRAEAKEKGYCGTCCTVKVSPGSQYCDSCLAGGHKPTKGVGRPPSFLNAQEGYEAPLKLAKKAATSGNCHWKGCPKKPDFEGVDYCSKHGAEYVAGLK
jgi:hypothetical protein